MNILYLFRFLLLVFVISINCCTYLGDKKNIHEKKSNGINSVYDDAYDSIDGKLLAVLVADNQHVEDYGDKIIEQGYFSAKISKTARRSCLNNLFGLDVFRLIKYLESKDENLPIIHLGDALNNGCKTELDDFISAMQKIKTPWFFTPGNHDSYYLGISYPEKTSLGYDYKYLSQRNGWGALCVPLRKRNRNAQTITKDQAEEGILTKNELIEKYLEYLYDNSYINSDPKSFYGFHNIASKNKYPLRKITWYLSESNDSIWKSFIAQEIFLDKSLENPISIILLDTTDFENKPMGDLSLFKSINIILFNAISPPLEGEISKNQEIIITRWLEKNKAQGINTIVAGHHPYNDLSSKTKNIISSWADNQLFETYISAHTHDGFYKSHTNFDEINIGSIIDAPVEYALINSSNYKNYCIKNVFLTKPKMERLHSIPDSNIEFKFDFYKHLFEKEEFNLNNQNLNMIATNLHEHSREGRYSSLLKELEV